jgi:hypothetical protein
MSTMRVDGRRSPPTVASVIYVVGDFSRGFVQPLLKQRLRVSAGVVLVELGAFTWRRSAMGRGRSHDLNVPCASARSLYKVKRDFLL